MHPFLVINPGSRNRKSASIAADYRRALTAAGVNHEAEYTRSLPDAERIARTALRAGFDPILAVGGDGTINRVIQGFFAPDGAVADARLGILYSGTSPDFCRYHGIPTDAAQAVSALLSGTVRRIDIGRVQHRDAGGELCTAYFASSVNIGLGAGIAARANRYRRRLGDGLGTLVATLMTIAAHRNRTLQMEVGRDGTRESHTLGRALNVTIGKNPHLAGGLKLGLEIAPDDGELFVLPIYGMGRLALTKALPSFYSGASARPGRFPVMRAETVTIAAPGDALQIEFDGDPAGFCPVEISILPRAIKLLGGRP